MPKISIDEVITKQTNGVHPLIVNFQNGYTTSDFKTIPCEFLEDSNKKQAVAMEIGGLVYAGSEEEEEIGQTLILARNRTTGKVRLLSVGRASVRPQLRSAAEPEEASAAPLASNLELSRKFGSKKNKQQMEQQEKLKMNIETVTEQVKNIAENIDESKVDLSQYNKTDSEDFYVPPMNRDADRVEDVFDVSQILSDEQFEQILLQISDKDWQSELDPVLKSKLTKSDKQNVLILYADSIIKFALKHVKEFCKKSAVHCPFSVTMNKLVFDNFTYMSKGKRMRSGQHKDKAIGYALVLLLLANNYKFNFEEFCKLVKQTPRTMSPKVSVTGASLVGSGSSRSVQLKLPLAAKTLLRRRHSAKF